MQNDCTGTVLVLFLALNLSCASMQAMGHHDEGERYSLCPYDAHNGLKELEPSLRRYIWTRWSQKLQGRVFVTVCNAEGIRSNLTIQILTDSLGVSVVQWEWETPHQPKVRLGEKTTTTYDSVERILGPDPGGFRLHFRNKKIGVEMLL